jgi:ppGpp synthetase/RelA/SpoT-type nucleotidyltranferase
LLQTEQLIRYGVCVPLPCSGRQFNALGQRLAESEPSDADLALFAQVLGVYQAVLDQVEQQLADLDFQATTRVKTTGTLVDKLRRDPTLKIKSIHDLAGARIVIEGSRRDQDAVRDSVVAAFAACPKPPIVKDRRETPSHGYRAVHVIVFPEDIPVEIQIRTLWQDRWAQVTESLGDNWGRGLRYGDGPDEPDALAGSGFAPSLTRARVVELWTRSSDVLDRMERMDLEVAEFQRLSGSGQLVDAGKLADAQRRFDENRGAWQALVTELGYGHIVAQDVSEGQS